MRDRKTKKFLEELSQINESVPIIVEGFRDVQALRALGIHGEIVKLHSGRSIGTTVAINCSIWSHDLWMRSGNRTIIFVRLYGTLREAHFSK